MRSSPHKAIRWLVAALLAFGVLFQTAAAADDDDRDGLRRAEQADKDAAADVGATAPGERRAARGRAPTAGQAKALEAVNAAIREYVAEHGTTHTFGSWVDTKRGEVVVQTDAPRGTLARDVLAAVAQVDRRGRSGTVTATSKAAPVALRIKKSAEIEDSWHRRDDSPDPHWGAAGITSGGGICSSGYTVESSSGYRYMVTAGHCFADWSSVTTETGTQTHYGWVWNRRLASLGGGPLDMELIYGRGYTNRIYTGGVTSTSSAAVVGAGTAYQGYTNYCHSGRTTGESCGHTAQDINGQVCTSSGCKFPVIVFTGGTMIQGGDSGGPFYAKSGSNAWIRGHVIASGGGTGYAETYLKVRDTYGVTAVTSP